MQDTVLNIRKSITKKSRLGEIDFENLRFGREFSDHMFIAEYSNGEWNSNKIVPFGAMQFSPGSSVFHYGQAIFEGLKAFRTDDDRILLFRPEENSKRLNESAVRMCMPTVPEEIFLGGLKALVEIDKRWIASGDGRALYIRPFLIADEAFLGVKPSEVYKFMIITSPTANYYSGAVKVKIETHFSRACQGGIGSTKAAANYAASLYPAQQARKEGYDQLIWTDSKNHEYIEEAGTMNIMFVINDKIVTPSTTSDSILSGITRKSVLQLAREEGIEVEERKVKVSEIVDAYKNGELKEAFGVGTAANVAFISLIGYNDIKMELSNFENWKYANKFKNALEDIKSGRVEDKRGWTVEV